MFRLIARAIAALCLCAAGITGHQSAFGMPLLILSNYSDGLIQDVDSNGNITTRISGLVTPEGIAVNTSGRLFVNNYVGPGPFNDTITQFLPNGTSSVFVSGADFGRGALIFDTHGNLYATDYIDNAILKIDSSGHVVTFATGLLDPRGLAFDGSGNLYVANFAGHSVTRIDQAGNVSTFATGFNTPTGLAFDEAGNLYVSDANACSAHAPGCAAISNC